MEVGVIQTLQDNELSELICAIRDEYGYDFSEYSEASLKRRVIRVLNNENINSVAKLKNRILTDLVFFNKFVEEVTVNVTEMFRDPSFYRTLTQDIFPVLSDLPLIRIWHAGCSTGEEVYSMAILLKEAGLLEKTLLYATDINQTVLQTALNREYSLNVMKEYSENYKNSGGKFNLSDYYAVKGDKVVFEESLAKRMVFSHHNLAIDQSFNAFNLILCRNVLIYFNRSLQEKVFKLFAESTAEDGFLALGTKETLEFSLVANEFNIIDKKNKIWKKKKS